MGLRLGLQYVVECWTAARVRPPRRIMERAVEAYRAGRIGVRAVALSGADPRATERELDEAASGCSGPHRRDLSTYGPSSPGATRRAGPRSRPRTDRSSGRSELSAEALGGGEHTEGKRGRLHPGRRRLRPGCRSQPPTEGQKSGRLKQSTANRDAQQQHLGGIARPARHPQRVHKFGYLEFEQAR